VGGAKPRGRVRRNRASLRPLRGLHPPPLSPSPRGGREPDWQKSYPRVPEPRAYSAHPLARSEIATNDLRGEVGSVECRFHRRRDICCSRRSKPASDPGPCGGLRKRPPGDASQSAPGRDGRPQSPIARARRSLSPFFADDRTRRCLARAADGAPQCPHPIGDEPRRQWRLSPARRMQPADPAHPHDHRPPHRPRRRQPSAPRCHVTPIPRPSRASR
jgi:hypothetical protein